MANFVMLVAVSDDHRLRSSEGSPRRDVPVLSLCQLALRPASKSVASKTAFSASGLQSWLNESNSGALVQLLPQRLPPDGSAPLRRSLLTQEGICLTLAPGFRFLEVAYPYVARRLLTDEDPILRERLFEVRTGGMTSWSGVSSVIRLAPNGESSLFCFVSGSAWRKHQACCPDAGFSAEFDRCSREELRRSCWIVGCRGLFCVVVGCRRSWSSIRLWLVYRLTY